jgi:hypothetical protein
MSAWRSPSNVPAAVVTKCALALATVLCSPTRSCARRRAATASDRADNLILVRVHVLLVHGRVILRRHVGNAAVDVLSLLILWSAKVIRLKGASRLRLKWVQTSYAVAGVSLKLTIKNIPGCCAALIEIVFLPTSDVVCCSLAAFTHLKSPFRNL